MTLYLDASALLKRYLDEPDRDAYLELMDADHHWLVARVAWVEVRRRLSLDLAARDADAIRTAFGVDWNRCDIIEIDRAVCDAAAHIAELTAARSLDAIHLAALQRAGPATIPLVTADIRQARAARSLGWTVLPI